MHGRIVVLGHGDTPQALVGAARMIGGSLAAEAVGLQPGERPGDYRRRVLTAIGDEPGAVVVLTDLRGGTPDNVAAVLARQLGDVQVVSNATLAVLLELAMTPDVPDADQLAELCELGRPQVTAGAVARR